MLIEPQNIHFQVNGNAICRNSMGEAVFTLTPQEIIALAEKKWIDGEGEHGKKGSDGVRQIKLKHVTLVVSLRKVTELLNRRSAKKIRSGRIKAEASKTWVQTGPTTYQPHLQRCYAFADNAGRIGVVRT